MYVPFGSLEEISAAAAETFFFFFFTAAESQVWNI